MRNKHQASTGTKSRSQYVANSLTPKTFTCNKCGERVRPGERGQLPREVTSDEPHLCKPKVRVYTEEERIELQRALGAK